LLFFGARSTPPRLKSLSAVRRWTTLKEARRLVGLVPVSARDASDPTFLERFAKRDAIDPALTGKWRAEIDAAQMQAQDLLARGGTAP